MFADASALARPLLEPAPDAFTSRRLRLRARARRVRRPRVRSGLAAGFQRARRVHARRWHVLRALLRERLARRGSIRLRLHRHVLHAGADVRRSLRGLLRDGRDAQERLLPIRLRVLRAEVRPFAVVRRRRASSSASAAEARVLQPRAVRGRVRVPEPARRRRRDVRRGLRVPRRRRRCRRRCRRRRRCGGRRRRRCGRRGRRQVRLRHVRRWLHLLRLDDERVHVPERLLAVIREGARDARRP